MLTAEGHVEWRYYNSTRCSHQILSRLVLLSRPDQHRLMSLVCIMLHHLDLLTASPSTP